jgi:hypothetical protein
MSRLWSLKAVTGAVLCGILVWTACSTAWIAEAEQIVGVLIPGIANLLTLVSSLEGKNVSSEDLQAVQSTGAQAEADLELLQSLITQYKEADADAQPGLLQQIQIELSAAQSNLIGLLPALHIKDAATEAKLSAVIEVLLSEVHSVAAIVPVLDASASSATVALASKESRMRSSLRAREFVSLYNRTMAAKTGDVELDRSTAELQIHSHGKFARWVSAGILN